MDTDSTLIKVEDGKFVVEAWGGYDGFIKRKFEEVEDAMDFVAWLWDLNTSTSAFYSTAAEGDTQRLLNRRKFHQQ